VLASKYFDLGAIWSLAISIPLRVAALPSKEISDRKSSTYLRLQVCKNVESKNFLFGDRKKQNQKTLNEIVTRFALPG
jgi:hypothetical protein